MIYKETILNVADNSGAKKVKCFNMGSRNGDARVGHKIRVSVRRAEPNANVKEGEVHYAVIVRTKSMIYRKNGLKWRSGDNAVVLVDAKGKMLGTRVLGCVARESGATDSAITSRALKVY
ncbi:uL14 family ribosomal protein [Candidatus Cytomitobacter primus]|uniref:Large ribosomal subunit protein uL14 n=1 Tax=Candidatus Cytomitobacter primus TaxID=2066024 RepID=A0A5C0UGC7_9PROT|nr:uL14 family ribosomal protein [Candidatus Cytomitobacter primus]QEK38731.1 uL14 family ribosomal protein [Candidatus Cytomitobacter primus]